MFIAFVITRIILNPVVNLCQKKLSNNGASSLLIVTSTYLTLSILSIPWFFVRGIDGLSAGFLITALLMTIAGTAGNLLLMMALKHSDLSVFGPINAFKPVIGLILAYFMISEIPSVRGVVGILIIVAGSFFLGHDPEGGISVGTFAALFRSRGVILRLASLCLISVEAVLMKECVNHAGVLSTFAVWALLGAPVLVMIVLLMRRNSIRSGIIILRSNPVTSFGAIILYGAMQLATLFVFEKGIVGFSLALFQLSTVISVFLGWICFRERSFLPRLAGSLIMIGGAILIIWY
jgi:drug/metabolite transporter (DMT)-like permease